MKSALVSSSALANMFSDMGLMCNNSITALKKRSSMLPLNQGNLSMRLRIAWSDNTSDANSLRFSKPYCPSKLGSLLSLLNIACNSRRALRCVGVRSLSGMVNARIVAAWVASCTTSSIVKPSGVKKTVLVEA